MRIYVTGSRGYIGSLLVVHFRSYRCQVFENQCDIRDYDKLLAEIVTAAPDVIIHLAACSTVAKCEKYPHRALTTNAIGTRNIISIMKVAGCSNIIYASSCAVYGHSLYPLTEYSKLNPLSVYGTTKLLGELCIRQSNVRYVIMRMSNVVGFHSHLPRRSDGTIKSKDRLFGSLFNCTQNGTPFTLYGSNYHTKDGTCSRDYIHVQDVVHAYYLSALRLHLRRGRTLSLTVAEPMKVILNLASGTNHTVGEIIRMWQDHNYHSGKPDLQLIIGDRRAGDPDSIAMTIHQLFQYLNWRPRLEISDIIGSYY